METRLSMMVLKRVGFLVNTLNTAKGPKPLCFLPTDLKLRHQSLVVKQALFSSSHCAFQAALRCSQSTFSIGLPPGQEICRPEQSIARHSSAVRANPL